MALTRKDVTIAAIVTFAAWLIAAQWIPVLKYAAYAFVSGIAITMLGLGALILRTSSALNPIESSTARRSTSLAILAPQTWNEDVALLRATSAYEPALLYPPSPPISNALHDLLQLIVQNSITTWYGNISKSPSFSNEVDRIFRAALATVRDRLLSVDVVEVAVSRMVPILNIHLRDAYNAEKAVRGEDLTRNVTESEELDRAIAGKYRDGTLHPAASLAFSDTKLLQQDYLRKVAERLIPEVLPESQTKSRVFEVLVRELLACAVLYPIMLMLSDPDTWNQIMEAYVGLYFPRRINRWLTSPREALCFKTVRRCASFELLSMNMPLQRLNQRAPLPSPSWLQTTTNASLRSLYAPSGNAAIYQKHADSGAKFLVS